MSDISTLTPAAELAARNARRVPGESAEYRAARNALLAEEIHLRREIERVAALRRALPPGGVVPDDYQFVGEAGPIRFSDLFGGHDTLVLYSYMFGPARKAPCPMCTSFMAAFEGKISDIQQRVAFGMVARGPIDRLVAAKAGRGWTQMPIYSDGSGDYTRAYVSATDEDIPGYNVFSRRDGSIRHFYGGEITMEMADPGQDPRDQPEMDPLWLLLDTTPEGRGTDWYPKLSYPGP